MRAGGKAPGGRGQPAEDGPAANAGGGAAALISFNGTGAGIDNLGYVSPIPEPSTCAAILGALALRRRARAA